MLKDKSDLFDSEYLKAIASEKKEQDRVFWRISVFYFTLIAFLGFSIAPMKLQFNFLGFSSSDLYALREVVLFLCAIISSYLFLLQSFIYQLEDILEESTEFRTSDQTSRNFLSLAYRSPFTALQVAYYPPPEHHAVTKLSLLILRLFDASRVGMVLAFVFVMLGVPTLAAYSVLVHPTHGLWVSIFVVTIWAASGILNVAHSLVTTKWLRFKDFSYVMKLQELEKKDPKRWSEIHAEIARTKKLPSLD